MNYISTQKMWYTCRVHLEGAVHELLREIIVVAIEEVLALGQQLVQGEGGAPGGGCVGGGGGIFCWMIGQGFVRVGEDTFEMYPR